MTALLPGSLFAVVLGLAGIVAYQTLAPVSPIEEPPLHNIAAHNPPTVLLAAYQPPPQENFAAVNARSLFDPLRQPVTEPEEAGMQSLMPPDLSLVGVAIGSEHSVALLKRPTLRAAISLQLGQSVDGWKLVKIEPGFVILHAGATDYTVKLRAAAGLLQPALNHASPPGTPEQPGQ